VLYHPAKDDDEKAISLSGGVLVQKREKDMACAKVRKIV
jgi:hypothetical protein